LRCARCPQARHRSAAEAGSRRAARRRGQEARAHRPGAGRPRGDRARAGGRGAEGRRRRDSEIKRAAYQAEIHRQTAQSAQAGPLADAEAREVELSAAAQTKKIEQIGNSEAAVTTTRGRAEGEATKARGLAEGEAIRAKGLAEAEAIAKRAGALEKEADAVIGQQIAEKLPEIVAAPAESFKHVDNLTVLNGAQGISEIIAQVIGQAGPALKMAQDALGRQNGAPP
jgi:flotillin